MPIYEYYCASCKRVFEQITSDRDPDRGKCNLCQTVSRQKKISTFKVGGRGDLREGTLDGCHDGESHFDQGKVCDGDH